MGFRFVCTPNTTLVAPFLYFELLHQSAVDSCHTCVPFTCISPRIQVTVPHAPVARVVWAQCQTFSVTSGTVFRPCLYLTCLSRFSPSCLSDLLSDLLSDRLSACSPPGFPLSDLLNLLTWFFTTNWVTCQWSKFCLCGFIFCCGSPVHRSWSC